MQSTKSQILAALKRHGRCSVDQLAAALGLAPMTVRQHLATLERDELVASREERQRLGRPHFLYSLTEKGEASFTQAYDRLAQQLVLAVADLDSAEIAGLTAEEKTALLFDKIADRVIDAAQERVRGLPLAERVAVVAQLLQQEGGLAEWTRTSDGFEILDYNCLYRRLHGAEGGPCRWHARLLSGLLGSPVEGCAAAPPSPQLCRFAVRRGVAGEEALSGSVRQQAPAAGLMPRSREAAALLPLDPS
jgi:DeoR family suf operon transcriptional repressor